MAADNGGKYFKQVCTVKHCLTDQEHKFEQKTQITSATALELSLDIQANQLFLVSTTFIQQKKKLSVNFVIILICQDALYMN